MCYNDILENYINSYIHSKTSNRENENTSFFPVLWPKEDLWFDIKLKESAYLEDSKKILLHHYIWL